LEGLTRLGYGFTPIQEMDDDDARLGRGLGQSLIGPRDETNGRDSRRASSSCPRDSCMVLSSAASLLFAHYSLPFFSTLSDCMQHIGPSDPAQDWK